MKASKVRPLILITNDDGVASPGLMAVAAALAPLGDLLLAAPRVQQTTMGRSFPRSAGAGAIQPLGLRLGEGPSTAFAIDGSPAQAVAHAVLELADRKPSLCVSGINYGENLGQSLTCGGTLGAAFEAASHGIPAIAVSLAVPFDLQYTSDYPDRPWGAAASLTVSLATAVLRDGLPRDTCLLNVNVPEGAGPHTPIHRTVQSRMNYSVFRKPEKRDLDRPFRLTSDKNPELPLAEPGSDIYAFVFEKAITITPISWDTSDGACWRSFPALEEILRG